MKKFVKVILLSGLLLIFMTGCENATANITNGKKMLMKVGKTTFTKGMLYDAMLDDDAGNTVVSEAMRLVADAEVETTPEIQEEAQKTYDDYKAQISETTDDPFEEAIKVYGYDSVEDFMNYCITTAKSSHLFEQYIDEKWNDLMEQYYPVKAKMIYIKTNDKGADEAYGRAQQAIDDIKAGKSFEEVAEACTDNKSLTAEKLYTRKSSSLDYNVLQYLTSTTTPGLSQVVTNQDATGYYVIMVTNVNQSQLKDEFVSMLKDDTDFGDTVTGYFFKKHNFTVYDIDTFNTIKSNYPAYLVQETGPKTSK